MDTACTDYLSLQLSNCHHNFPYSILTVTVDSYVYKQLPNQITKSPALLSAMSLKRPSKIYFNINP